MAREGKHKQDQETDQVFLHIDNLNVFSEAQRLAPLKNGGDPGLRYRVRIDYDALVRLCCAERTLFKALVAGLSRKLSTPTYNLHRQL